MINPNSTIDITINTGYWTLDENRNEVPERRQVTAQAQIEKTAIKNGEQLFVGWILNSGLQDYEFKAIKEAVSDLEHPSIESVSATFEGGEECQLIMWEGMRASTPDRLSIQGKIIPPVELPLETP